MLISRGLTVSGVFRFDGQRFQRNGPNQGLPREVALSLGEASDGSLLAGYRGGVYQQSGHHFEKLSLPGKGVDEIASHFKYESTLTSLLEMDRVPPLF